MPSKHISYISEGAEQHVSYQFDTIQEMIEFERFLQENTFEKYQQDQKIAFDLTESAMKKFQSLPDGYGEIDTCKTKSRPWIIDWDKVEEEIGPEYKWFAVDEDRSEEHTSELQSRENLVCRLLLEKKNRRAAHTVAD